MFLSMSYSYTRKLVAVRLRVGCGGEIAKEIDMTKSLFRAVRAQFPYMGLRSTKLHRTFIA
jgi:hypothetical protein